MKTLFFHPRHYFHGPGAVGHLILRLVVGYALALHGTTKIQNPFGWMGPEGPPGFLQALAAVSEFFGGIAIMLGLFTPLACLGVMCTMFVAIWSHIGRGNAAFVGGKGVENSYELAALYFVCALTLFLTGPGLLSVDAALAKVMTRRGAATSSP